MFAGFVKLDDDFSFAIQTVDAEGEVVDADAQPAFRTYGAGGVLQGGTGTASFLHTGDVTGATAASPVVVTSAAHGLGTGMRVKVSGVGGLTGASGAFTVTVLTADTFSLDGSSGSGSYTSGGTWHVVGLYGVSFAASGAGGFDAGESYTVHASWAVSSSARAEVFTVAVV